MSTTRNVKADHKLKKIQELASDEESDNSNAKGLKKLSLDRQADRNISEEERDQGEEAKEYQYEFIMQICRPYRKVLYFLIKNGYLKERTPFCKHAIKSCYLNSLEGFCTNFFYGFMTKAVINILLGLMKPSKRLLPNIADLFSSDCMSFCTFLGAFSGFYKFMMCTLRRWRGKDDQLNSIISGAIAALSLLFENSQRRKKFLVLYLFCRSLEMLVNVLDKKKYIKKIKYFECYMFGPLLGYLFYAYMYETECFPKGIDKAFLSTSTPTIREYSMFEDIFQRQGRIYFPGPAKKLRI